MAVSLYRTILQQRQDLFNEALRNGIYTPFLLPWDTMPVLFLSCGIALTPNLSGPATIVSRWLLAALSVGYMAVRWPYARTVGLTSGYGIGLSAFWGLIMTVILLLLHDPGKDFKRIEVRRRNDQSRGKEAAINTSADTVTNGELRRRKAVDNKVSTDDRGSSKERHLVWQEQPNDFYHLVDWSFDLMTSFRAINWEHRVPIRTYTVKPPQGNPLRLSQEDERRHTGALRQLRRDSIRNFLFYYIALDFLKTIMVTDPYWLGIAPLNSPSTWPWLLKLEEIIPGITQAVRLGGSVAGVVSALTFIFSLNPLFFTVVLPYLIGGDKLYSLTKCPLLEVWMYPAQWGNMFSTICSRGLAGFWGTWWHQMFRYGISEPAKLLTERLQLDPRSQLGRVLQLFVAFGLTGGIHAVASSTTFSIVPSKPWNPFLFFLSQAILITIQTEISRRVNKLFSFPAVLQQAGNLGFVLLVAWYTGPLLADDFARCGIWLFEPVPVSFLRGLGFGSADCWIPWLQFPSGGRWLGLWRGKHWYTSGLGIY